MPKALGFVHNPESDAGAILSLGGSAAACAKRDKTSFESGRRCAPRLDVRRRQLRPSKNSFILAKKPALSGWVLFDDSASNSVKQLALAARQVLRRLDDDLDVEVAEVARAQHRHALAAQPELAPGLRALRDADLGLGAVERRTVNSPPSAACTIEIGTRQ